MNYETDPVVNDPRYGTQQPRGGPQQRSGQYPRQSGGGQYPQQTRGGQYPRQSRGGQPTGGQGYRQPPGRARQSQGSWDQSDRYERYPGQANGRNTARGARNGPPTGTRLGPSGADWPTREGPLREGPLRAPRPGRKPKKPRRRATVVAGRFLAAASAIIVLSGTGSVYYKERSVDNGFTRSNVISADDATLDGDMNILLIGLDSRKDQNGNDLPKDILDELHAGDGSEGGYNANTLILLHLPKDLKKITAFSIPRDDYIRVNNIPGYDHAKIKETYGLAKAYREQQLLNQGVKDPVDLEHEAREAGRKSIVTNVMTLTGVKINLFAEVSLVGFYHLADILGGIDVCLNHAVDDSYYSGADFPAGRQHLDASDALAFVRQRHELDNGDLDRTHRQQAFLAAVAMKLKQSGTLTNIGKLQQLINAAQQDIVLSQGWNLLTFAQTVGRAGSIPIEFQTLPVVGYDNVDGQDVNVIDPNAIKKTVQDAFDAQPTSVAPKTPPTSTVDVVNAGSIPGMAAKVSAALTAKGFPRGNTGNVDMTSSAVYYGSGAEVDANQVADVLGGGIAVVASKNVDPGHVKVIVGSDFSLPDSLASAAGSSSDSSTSSNTTTTTPTRQALPDSGTPVDSTIGDDIPCVN